MKPVFSQECAESNLLHRRDPKAKNNHALDNPVNASNKDSMEIDQLERQGTDAEMMDV